MDAMKAGQTAVKWGARSWKVEWTAVRMAGWKVARMVLQRHLGTRLGGMRAGQTAVYWDVMKPKDAKMAE